MKFKQKTTEEFIREAKSIHGDKYNYSESIYINSANKLKIICQVHGVFEQSPNVHLSQKQGCPKCVGRNLSNDDFIKKVKVIIYLFILKIFI